MGKKDKALKLLARLTDLHAKALAAWGRYQQKGSLHACDMYDRHMERAYHVHKELKAFLEEELK